jgi:hypothetical protein
VDSKLNDLLENIDKHLDDVSNNIKTDILVILDERLDDVSNTIKADIRTTTDTHISTKLDSRIDYLIEEQLNNQIKRGLDARIHNTITERLNDTFANVNNDGALATTFQTHLKDSINNENGYISNALSDITKPTNSRLDSLEDSYRILKADLVALDTDVSNLMYPKPTYTPPPLPSPTDTPATVNSPIVTATNDPAFDTPRTDNQTTPVTVDPPNQRWPHVNLSPIKPPVQPTAHKPTLTTPPAIKPTSTYRPTTINLPPQLRNPTSISRDKYALDQRISQKYIIRLANTPYHHGPNGLYPLTEQILIECGYTTESHHGLAEVIICYNDIIKIHNTVCHNWDNNRYGTS